jgi:hypothetical protein
MVQGPAEAAWGRAWLGSVIRRTRAWEWMLVVVLI